MVDFEDPKTWILLPVAVWMALEVGLALSEARNEAAIPLLGECPGVLVNFIGSNYSPELIAGTMECGIGVILLLSIPGVLGVGKMVLEQ